MTHEEIMMRAQVMHDTTDMDMNSCIAQVQKIKALYDKMQVGVVSFKFRKKDGTIRTAVGTLVHDLIKYDFKGTGQSSPSVLPYWDMEKESFRCFSLVSYIGMEGDDDEKTV